MTKDKKKNITAKPKKNIKNNKTKSKQVKSYIDEKDYELSPEMKNAVWIISIVFVIFLAFYVFSAIATGNPIIPKKEKAEDESVEIQFEEILVGQSFDKGENYVVVYYDFSDNENEDLSKLKEAYDNYKYSQNETKVYTCDLSSPFNKIYVTSEEINYNPQNAEELKLNGTTVIKFNNGTVETFVNGLNESIDYLNSINPMNHE